MTVPDIPRLNTAVAEWLACMVFVLTRDRRFGNYATAAVSAAFLLIITGFQFVAGTLPLYLWIPSMLSALLIMFGFIWAACRVRPMEVPIIGVRAFILAEFAASLEWQLNYYFHDRPNFTSALVQALLLIFIFLAVFLVAWFAERRYQKLIIRFDITAKNVFYAFGIGTAIFLTSNISFISRNTPLSGTYASDIFLIRTLVDFCGLILFYSIQEQRLWAHARLEVSAMRNLLDRQYEQYRLSKENMEFLNHRFHDLKHHISALKAETSPEKQTEYLEKMEAAIRHFEVRYDTDNKALDILLSGKSKNMADNGINFTCVADGGALREMDTIDICSIVGNALDNAIESVKTLDGPEKKIIKMAIFSQNDFAMMRFENYFESKIRIVNGDIATTKHDERSHGYGIKSIRKAAEKYDGHIKISIEDNWFALCVLIPPQHKNNYKNNV